MVFLALLSARRCAHSDARSSFSFWICLRFFVADMARAAAARSSAAARRGRRARGAMRGVRRARRYLVSDRSADRCAASPSRDL